jgi:hypothetical protein
MNIEMFFTTEPYTIITIATIAVAALFSLIALIVSITSRNRISRMLRGKSARDIDDVLVQIYRNISTFEQFQTRTQNDLAIIHNKLSNSVQSIETIRFNPFKGNGTGGNQSFATAIINEYGDGVILSSLYSSDRVSVFAKPLVKFASTYELTEEENQALQQATEKMRGN